jgi:Ca2+-binding RTX toxin-like protein
MPANVERMRLTGSANIDAYGSSGNDDIAGNAGNNVLYGYEGTDTLAGGTGDDLYVLADGGDTILELANEGNDKVYAAFTTTLAANVENLSLTTTAAADGTGNALDNTITGSGGANVLTGLAGNDTLDGDEGADRLVGGSGNDAYVVDHAGRHRGRIVLGRRRRGSSLVVVRPPERCRESRSPRVRRNQRHWQRRHERSDRQWQC